MKSVVKDSQWYDVGIVKVTNMVVTHYYVPYNGSVMDVSTSPSDCFSFSSFAVFIPASDCFCAS